MSVVSATLRAHRGSRPRAHCRSSGPWRRNSRLMARVSPALARASSSAEMAADFESFDTEHLAEKQQTGLV